MWDSAGRPVADRGSRFSGLGNYGMRGMGADGDFGGEYTGPVTAPPTSYSLDPYLEPGGTSIDLGPGYFGGSGSGLTVPSQGSPQWAAFASQALKDGFTLAAINSMPAGSVINPNGQLVRQTAGYAVTPGTLVGQQLASLGGSSNLLLIGGGLLAAVLLFSMMGKK